MSGMSDEAAGGDASGLRHVAASPFLLPVAATLVVFWLLAGIVMMADPYDLYDWGPAPRLFDDYDTKAANSLYSIVSRAPYDVLVIGGSSVAPIRSRQVRDAFPEARSAFNLSVNAPRPADRAILFSLLERRSRAQRIIVSLDWIYALPTNIARNGFPLHRYDGRIASALRNVSPDAIHMAFLNLAGKPLTLPGWDRAAKDIDYEKRYRAFQSDARQDALRDSIRDDPYIPSDAIAIPCDAFPAMMEILVPSVRALAARETAVDILIPPYAIAQYHTWHHRRDEAAVQLNPFLEKQIAMRRCAVDALATVPGVRIFAFDTDPAITADLTRYRDPAHLHGTATFNDLLGNIAAGRGQLTPGTFDKYEAQLVGMVRGLYSSAADKDRD